MTAAQRETSEPPVISARLIASAQRLGADPAEYAAHLGADKAPPLTAEQRDRLAPLLSAPAPAKSDAA